MYKKLKEFMSINSLQNRAVNISASQLFTAPSHRNIGFV